MTEKDLIAKIKKDGEIVYINVYDDKDNKVFKEDLSIHFISQIKDLRQDVADRLSQIKSLGINIVRVEENFLDISIENI